MDIVVHPIRFTIPSGFVDYTPYIFTLRDSQYRLELILAEKRAGQDLRELLLDHLRDRKTALGKRVRVKNPRRPVTPVVVDEHQGMMATVEIVAENAHFVENCQFIEISSECYLRLFFRFVRGGRLRTTFKVPQLSLINASIRINRPRMQEPPDGFVWYQIGPVQILLSQGWTPPEAFFLRDPAREISLSVKTVTEQDFLESSPLEIFGIPQQRAHLLAQGDQPSLDSDIQQYVIREPEADGDKQSFAITSRRQSGDRTVVVLGRQFQANEGNGLQLDSALHNLLESMTLAPSPPPSDPLQTLIRPPAAMKRKARGPSSVKQSRRSRKRRR